MLKIYLAALNSNRHKPNSRLLAKTFFAVPTFGKTTPMKRLLLCLSLGFLSPLLCAQPVTDTVHRLFKGELNGDAIRAYFGEENRYINPRPEPEYGPFIEAFIPTSLVITKQLLEEKIQALKALRTDSAFRKARPNYTAEASFDSAAVLFTVYRINRKNAGDFEFRVLENKQKEVLSWSPVKLFCETYTLTYDSNGKEETEMAYLGEFKTSPGNNLTVDLRKKGSSETASSMTVAWVNAQPEVLGVFTNKEFPDFFRVFKRESQLMVSLRSTPEERSAKDPLLVLKKRFAADEASLLFFLNNKVRFKEMIEYRLQGPGGFQEWKKNDLDENLIWLRDLLPGQYKLFIRYSFQRHNVTEYGFEIKPAWHQTTAFKLGAGSLTAAFFGFVFLLFKTRTQKQALQKERLQRQRAQTELKAVHAQLNPHFIFNALSSIQGLVNKGDVDAANGYLSEFSSLLRSTLKEGEKEFTALSTEMAILQNYLKLEGLRFGFGYSICGDEWLDATETEVPALLLQPLVENAVKHGVALLRERGRIDVRMQKQQKDLIVTVADNGPGFVSGNKNAGHGIKLTETRIALLNTVLKEQSIRLYFSKEEAGMRVTLHFTNWL